MCGRIEHAGCAPGDATRSAGKQLARTVVRRMWQVGPGLVLACATLACPQLREDDFGLADGGLSQSSTGGSHGGRPGGPGGVGGAGPGPAGGAGPTAGAGGTGDGCGGAAEFGTPVVLGELTVDGSYWAPALSNDGLTLYFAFASAVDAGDLYRAKRRNLDSPFAPPAPINELNTPGTEGTPYVTADGTIYFSSDRSGQRDIWRAAPMGPGFSAPQVVPVVNSSAFDAMPCLSADGLRLMFGSDRDGGAGGADLWIATRPTLQGDFSSVLPLSELNTNGRDEGASLTVDDLHVYFTSDRPGGEGGLDIWYSSRYNAQSSFSPPVNLASVNSSGIDATVHVSRNGNELFFSSSRGGSQRLWRSERCR